MFGHIAPRAQAGSGLVVADGLAGRDGDPVPGVDRGDLPDQVGELLGVEMARGLVGGGRREVRVGDAGDGVGERQRRSLALVEEGRLVPGSDRLQPLLRFVGLARVLGVQVDAVGAAVQDRGVQLHQLA